jgi:ATP-binding cassette subfamily C (CFTR/MRP) protein 1
LTVDKFYAKEKSFIGVIGSFGSGKTSFIHAILGEMKKLQGSIETSGKIAYIS